MTTHGDVIYSSTSKGDVRIGDMATPWLANSWRKLGGTSLEPEHNDSLVIRAAMYDELRERGCTYSAETDQWTFPAKEPA